jgi:hypothetical protein
MLLKKTQHYLFVATKLPVNEIFTNWWHLERARSDEENATSRDYLFRSYSSLKMICLKMKCKNHKVLVFLGVSKRLCKRLRPSVHLLVGPSVTILLCPRRARAWLEFCSFCVLRPSFQSVVTSKRMIGKGPGWLHSLRLIEFFPDLFQFFKIVFTESFTSTIYLQVLLFLLAT